jgi:glutamyl-tRNA synthetase
MTTSRLAPSPTGAQHLGNARTYLIADWSAKQNGHRMILRIEDVDSPRVKTWATQQAIDDLRWLGIDWDEGPEMGGPNWPYIQTQRTHFYSEALDRLIESDHVYPCTCTRKDIEESGSAPHFDHEPSIYSGLCAGWRNGDRLPEAGTYCWRFRATAESIAFTDLVAGDQSTIPATTLGDFPVTQKNGQPSYQLAVVVDDAAMGITEVVRGNDLIASTFRQLDLFAALQLVPPTFAHVPLVQGSDGRRLAKRHGDTRLSHLRAQGVAAEEIRSWAAESAGLASGGKDFRWDSVDRNDVVVPDVFLQ